MQEVKCDILVIGAGAAGMFVTHYASLNGKSVCLVDHNNRTGRKILISGGGRCNFTNIHSCHRDFVSQNPHFCKSALSQYSPQDFIHLIEQAHIQYFEKKLGQLFCRDSAKDIIRLLEERLKRKNIKTFLNVKNLNVEEAEEGFKAHNNHWMFKTKKLVLATGGLSIPSLGASDFGHRIAKQFGHKIIPPEPALVPFKISRMNHLAGVSLVAEVNCGKQKICEDVLFTHKGLSGPAILKISLYWNPQESLRINWLPKYKLSELLHQSNSHYTIGKILKQYLPDRFVIFLLERIDVSPQSKLPELSKKKRQELEKLIHFFEVTPEGTEGFRKAEVTRGGVDTQYISSQTMESQLKPGLYFIGEVLDVTGQLGGHNFQWAWASAYAAGKVLA